MKQVIQTNRAPRAIGAYSQAVRAGHLLYVAGQIGLDPDSMALVSDVFSAQATQLFNNIEAIVEAAGGRLLDVIKLTVYITDFQHYDALNAVIQQRFQAPYPARAVVAVSALPKDALLEIEAVACLD